MTRTPSTAVKLLTIPEAAEHLRTTRYHVYRLISAGGLRAVNIAVHGRPAMRVREDDLAAFIEQRTASSAAPTTESALAASS